MEDFAGEENADTRQSEVIGKECGVVLSGEQRALSEGSRTVQSAEKKTPTDNNKQAKHGKNSIGEIVWSLRSEKYKTVVSAWQTVRTSKVSGQANSSRRTLPVP